MDIVDSLKKRENSDRGMYMNMCKAQMFYATIDGLYAIDDMEFERLNGPQDYVWRDAGDMAASYTVRDLDVISPKTAYHMQQRYAGKLYVDRDVAYAFYKKWIDKILELSFLASTRGDLYILVDLCNALDATMEHIHWWRTFKPTFERVEKRLLAVERKLDAKQDAIKQEAEHRYAYLQSIGYVPKKEVHEVSAQLHRRAA